MLKTVRLFLWAVIVNVICVTGFAAAAENQIRAVDVQTLAAWLGKPEMKTIIVDAGSMLACLDAKIPGALCVPCDAQATPPFLSSVTKESKMIFYTAHPPLDPDCGLIRQVLSRGFRDVYILKDGLVSWRKAGLPVISEEKTRRIAGYAVPPGRLAAWRKQAKNPLVIDIRAPKAYAAGHLDGAVNIPLSRLHVQYGDIPLDRTLLVVDEDGRAAFLAASFLARKGFQNVQRLQGGMAAHQRGPR